jgi:hypothetical protein
MKTFFSDILGVLGAIAVAVLLVYLRWKSLEGRVRDLGDGGIQTIFGTRKPR